MHTPRIRPQLVEVNMAHDERFVRGLLGGSLIVFAIFVPYPWAWSAVYLLITGLVGICPIYWALRIQRHHDVDV